MACNASKTSLSNASLCVMDNDVGSMLRLSKKHHCTHLLEIHSALLIVVTVRTFGDDPGLCSNMCDSASRYVQLGNTVSPLRYEGIIANLVGSLNVSSAIEWMPLANEMEQLSPTPIMLSQPVRCKNVIASFISRSPGY
jgi:hypothetical protein